MSSENNTKKSLNYCNLGIIQDKKYRQILDRDCKAIVVISTLNSENNTKRPKLQKFRDNTT